jgi:hypothetical protein
MHNSSGSIDSTGSSSVLSITKLAKLYTHFSTSSTNKLHIIKKNMTPPDYNARLRRQDSSTLPAYPATNTHRHHQPTPPPALINMATEIPKIRSGGGRGHQDPARRQPTRSQ